MIEIEADIERMKEIFFFYEDVKSLIRYKNKEIMAEYFHKTKVLLYDPSINVFL